MKSIDSNHSFPLIITLQQVNEMSRQRQSQTESERDGRGDVSTSTSCLVSQDTCVVSQLGWYECVDVWVDDDVIAFLGFHCNNLARRKFTLTKPLKHGLKLIDQPPTAKRAGWQVEA
eukprot:scaffold398_cov177-Ochromonas_danica.AAC.15